MNYFEEILENKLSEEKALCKKLKRRYERLSRYEGVRLDYHFCKEKERGAYYLHERGESYNQRTYCGKSQAKKVANIQEYRYLKEAIRICEKNIKSISQLLTNYHSPYPDDVAPLLSRAYQDQSQSKEWLFGACRTDKWLKKKTEFRENYFSAHPVSHPENLTQLTVDGTATRSKSEVNIYDFLYSIGCKIIYEMPVFIDDTWYVADFLVLLPNGAEIIIEHMGMTHVHSYMDYKSNIIEKFIRSGWVPNVNLIVTYDDVNGSIDMQAIARQIYAFMR